MPPQSHSEFGCRQGLEHPIRLAGVRVIQIEFQRVISCCKADGSGLSKILGKWVREDRDVGNTRPNRQDIAESSDVGAKPALISTRGAALTAINLAESATF